MSYADKDFYTLLDLVIHPKMEACPLKLGNVEFWKETDGTWCYSILKKDWDIQAVSLDLTKLIEEQIK